MTLFFWASFAEAVALRSQHCATSRNGFVQAVAISVGDNHIVHVFSRLALHAHDAARRRQVHVSEHLGHEARRDEILVRDAQLISRAKRFCHK